jgi:hypothetical protein
MSVESEPRRPTHRAETPQAVNGHAPAITMSASKLRRPACRDVRGDRGILHDENTQIVRTSRNMMWLICRLEFSFRRGELMSPDHDSNRAIVEGFHG